MARYLTPSKISLLALISVYTENVVPASAVVPILSFLISSLRLGRRDDAFGHAGSTSIKLSPPVDIIQEATIPHASGIPGRTVWDLLLNKLWGVDSLDALHTFFDHSALLLQTSFDEANPPPEGDPAANRTRLSKSSPLGIFVRRAQLEFSRLQFHDGVALWQHFVEYRSPTLPQWRKRNPSASGSESDINVMQFDPEENVLLRRAVYGANDASEAREWDSVSAEDIEKLLEHQVEAMQRMGTRMPEVVFRQLQVMLKAGNSMPKMSYYVQFLDAWKKGDYPTSFDHLHRYFDYTMHDHFGSYSEAVSAMHETIATAREHNDLGCLNYSLSWLYHFGKAHPKYLNQVQEKGVLGSDKEALMILKAKAKESGMWSVLSSSLLSEARLALSNGDSAAQAMEGVLKASQINLTKNVANAVGSQMIVQSTVFGRLGVNCQSWLSEHIFLHCYKARSPAEDILHCICRIALLLAQRGRYREALASMDQVDEEALRTLNYQQFWAAHAGMLRMRRCLCLNNLNAARHVLSQLQALKTPGHDLSYEITLLEIELYIRRKDFTQSMHILEETAKRLKECDVDIYQHVKLMILKACIYDKAGIPQKGFSVAVRAATLAHRAKILPLLWEAICALCAVLHSVKEFASSVKLLESIIPQVLECEDSDLAARALLLLADAHVGIAGETQNSPQASKEHLTKGLQNLDQALDEFSKIEDVQGQCQSLAKKATIMHLHGDPVLANDCAAQYLVIQKAARDKQ